MFFVPFGAGPAHVVSLGMVWANDHASQSARELHPQSAQPVYKTCDVSEWAGRDGKHGTIRMSLPHNVPVTAYKFEMGASPFF